jgi:HAD superfamily hydrolase (TIGR01458 family)
MIEGILLDLSGVLYVGQQPIRGAVEAIVHLRQTQLPMRFVTNTTRSTRAMVIQHLGNMGFEIDESEVYTAPSAARDYLRLQGLSPYLLVHPNLEAEFSDLVTTEPNAVLIGDAGDAFTYAHMNRAFRLLMTGAPLIAMGRNRYFQEADDLSLDAGPFVQALEYAVGTEAIITGKPAPEFFQAAVASLGCEPDQTVMVGDDVEADVNGATAAGLKGVLVRTGKYRAGDETRLESEAAVTLPDISAFVDWLEKAVAQPD